MDFAVRQPEGTYIMNPLTSLYQNTKCSDLTVYCRGKTYPVHRAILRARSQFFDGACRNQFNESQHGCIDLSEDDPEAVEHMMTYFYSLDYLPTPRLQYTRQSYDSDSEDGAPQTPSLASTPSTPLSPTLPATPTFAGSLHRTRRLDLSLIEDPLLAIAKDNQLRQPKSIHLSRFGITSPLVAKSEDASLLAFKPQQPEVAPQPNFETMMKDSVEENNICITVHEDSVPEQETNHATANLVAHAKVYAIAEQYGIRDLKLLAKKKYDAQITTHRESAEFALSLPKVYDGTVENDRGLRDIVIATFRRFPELAQRPEVDEIVKDTPSLAWELFRVAWGLPV